MDAAMSSSVDTKLPSSNCRARSHVSGNRKGAPIPSTQLGVYSASTILPAANEAAMINVDRDTGERTQ